jgi:hypothetical protein
MADPEPAEEEQPLETVAEEVAVADPDKDADQDAESRGSLMDPADITDALKTLLSKIGVDWNLFLPTLIRAYIEDIPDLFSWANSTPREMHRGCTSAIIRQQVGNIVKVKIMVLYVGSTLTMGVTTPRECALLNPASLKKAGFRKTGYNRYTSGTVGDGIHLIRDKLLRKDDGEGDDFTSIYDTQGDDNIGDIQGFMEKQTSLAGPKPLIKRFPLNYKTTWNGKTTSFGFFKSQIESWLYQIGAGYMIDERFLLAYGKNQWNDVTRLQNPDVCDEQFLADKTLLYGALGSACRGSVAQKHLTRARKTCDGVLAWINFITEYDNNGNKELKKTEYETILHQNWSTKHPGGLDSYIDDIENAYVQLEELAEHTADSVKRRQLLAKFFGTDMAETAFQAQDHPSCKTFIGLCNHLRTHAKYVIPDTTMGSGEAIGPVLSSTLDFGGEVVPQSPNQGRTYHTQHYDRW